MIHVETDGMRNGLVQVFLAKDDGPEKTIAAAWVFVKRGKVGIGTGNAGKTGIDVASSSTGRWEYLQAENGVFPSNLFIIYAASERGAEFYVAEASVSRSPYVISEENPEKGGLSAKWLPPLEFDYTQFKPLERDFFPVTGADLPARSLDSSNLELADLFGNGLPDILEMNDTIRYWRNLGGGKFDRPREMKTAPAGLYLGDPGVQLIDADGDGRIDLLVNKSGLSGYFPLKFSGEWDRRSFQRYAVAPSFDLQGPEVKLVDLNGDGVTDAIRSGSRLECFFNDPKQGWKATGRIEPGQDFPSNFSDPRVKWGDMSGDGLQDILLVHDGNIEYWPNLGWGNWGKRVTMRNSPRFRYGYNPSRILVDDVDGDGLADIVYVDDRKVILWINQSGNGWSDPIEIKGTPPVSDMDGVRLVDLLGTGVKGVLWTANVSGQNRHQMYFLDFTGGVKPYLLHQMDNHMGAVTRVKYESSIRFSEEDRLQRQPWKTPLPFPVQVVSQVEVIDQISKGKLTTEYRYHYGYWDGAEREFRGFGRVEQLDTETFEQYDQPGLHGAEVEFQQVDRTQHFSPPTLTKTWFHQGPVGDEFGEWEELDYSDEYWAGDAAQLERPQQIQDFLRGLRRRAKRDALRTLRGQVLRTELYALDGSPLQDRPYTVTESISGVREEAEIATRNLPRSTNTPEPRRIFFPFGLAQRTTQWERGQEPMSQFSFTDKYDLYGQPRRQISIGVPRGRNIESTDFAREPYLITLSETDYAQREDDDRYIVDRVVRTTTYEIPQNGNLAGNPYPTLMDLVAAIRDGSATRVLFGQTLNYYDGAAFKGIETLGQLGDYGALVRTQSLVLNQETLAAAYGEAERPPYFPEGGNITLPGEYPRPFGERFGQAADPTAGYVYEDGTKGAAAGYFVMTERRQYDFQSGTGRGLVTTMRDPLGRDTIVTYDAYDLLPLEVTDPAGLTTKAKYDYRVMQPESVTDPNGNETEFQFSPLGLLQAIYVKGHPDKVEGDRTRASTRFAYDFLAFANSRSQPISVTSIRHMHHDTEMDVPEPQRSQTITTVEYSDGFGRLLQTRTQGEEDRFGHGTWGGGDTVLPLLQSQNATGLVTGQRNDNPEQPNVVVSGWQVYDNKGRVVEKYEPFFSTGWGYGAPGEPEKGQRVTMFYDPRGQVIRTVNPDGSEQRVVYGIPVGDLSDPEQFEPTPWEAYTYDANDNAGRTHPDTSQSYRHHWNTPSSLVIDALGRTVETVERHREKPATATDPLPPIEAYHTRSTYDIRGNVLTVTDALGREAFHYTYDLANNPLRIESIDAGSRRMVLDGAGNEIERRDSKGALILREYDQLNRPQRVWARDQQGEALTLREWLFYGDEAIAIGLTREQAQAHNLLGKLYKHHDEAGELTFDAYDFKGNLLQKSRRVIKDDEIKQVFEDAGTGAVKTFRVDWLPPSDPPADRTEEQEYDILKTQERKLLSDTLYETATTYDALNRVKRLVYPLDGDGQRKVLVPQYNRAGALKQVEWQGQDTSGNAVRMNGQSSQTYVERIAYNAKGQRVLIAYGNGVMTRYAYDPQTFRLVRLRTERYESPEERQYKPKGAPLQDFAYRYDLAGNILQLSDRTPRSGVANNLQAAQVQAQDAALADLLRRGDGLDRQFEYDPLYRLRSATGRESKDIAQPRPWADDPREGFNQWGHGTPATDNAPNLTTLYRERYDYDAAGNMLWLTHDQTVQRNGGMEWQPGWTRQFGMGAMPPIDWDAAWQAQVQRMAAGNGWELPGVNTVPGNQLTHVLDSLVNGSHPPTVNQTHQYDPNGNLTRENGARFFEWDHSDRMRAFRVGNEEGTSNSVYAHYLYDASGQRVKKLVRKGANHFEITVYIDGIFEHHFETTSGSTKENNSLHVMDNQSRIALVRIGNAFDANDRTPAVQYHLGDHLGSCNVVIDDSGTLVNREEYFPYGETSFGSFGKKRYRYSGKERDEESGLYYFGARYYLASLNRWASCDPAGTIDGLNVYSYVNAQPINNIDPNGYQLAELQDAAVELFRAANTDKESVRTLVKLAPAAASAAMAAETSASAAFATAAVALPPVLIGTAGLVLVGAMVAAPDPPPHPEYLRDPRTGVVQAPGIQGSEYAIDPPSTLLFPPSSTSPSAVPGAAPEPAKDDKNRRKLPDVVNIDASTVESYATNPIEQVLIPKYLADKVGVITVTARQEALQNIERRATPEEALLAFEFLSQLIPIPDNPDPAYLNLKTTNTLKENDKRIFGTGSTLNVKTTTADGQFVRSAEAQGVYPDVWLHGIGSYSGRELEPAQRTQSR